MHRSSIFSFDTIRGLRPRIDTWLILVLAAVVLVEVGLRLAIDHLPGNPCVKAIRETTAQGYYPPPHLFDRDCGYLYRPNQVGRFVRTDFDTRFITNQHGFHGAPFLAAKPDDLFRVVLLGDSRLAANHVSIEQTWVHLLQNRLKPIRGKKVELLNLGVDGYLPWNVSRLLELKVERFDPDAVVLWCDAKQWTVPEERYRLATAQGVILESHDPDLLLAHAISQGRESTSLRLLIPRKLRLSGLLNNLCGKVAPSNIRRIEGKSPQLHEPLDLLRGMKEFCDQKGFPLAVFYREHNPPPGQDLCQKLGIPTWSDELVVPDYKELAWPNDAHFCVSGNAIYAEKVTSTFQKMLEQLAAAE